MKPEIMQYKVTNQELVTDEELKPWEHEIHRSRYKAWDQDLCCGRSKHWESDIWNLKN